MRTLARRRQERNLSPDESDRVYRAARLVAQAEEVLGDLARAARWFKAPNRALGHARPLDLLDTDIGSRQVEEVLGRVDAGVYG